MGRVNTPMLDPIDAVTRLRNALAATTLPDEAAAEAHAVVNQFDDYILPRLTNLDAPLLAVIGGSTGSGKSTLVNALLRERVSNPGVIRPTTRQPVLVANPGDAEWFNSPRVLPGLTRSHGAGNEQSTTLRIVETPNLPQGLSLLDAPDFDSIDDRNRALATQLLAAADLWIFVTTPARYADQLVWNFLHDAAARGIEVVVVLNRLDEASAETVPQDLRRMMAEAGLEDATVFTVPFVVDLGNNQETQATDEFLPAELVAPLNTYLHELAQDTAARRAVAGKTVAGAVEGALAKVDAAVVTRQRREDFANQLDATIFDIYKDAHRHIIDATSDGQMLRSEVMDRWQDVVGTSDVFRGFERWFSQTVDKVGSFFSGQPAPLREVETELESGLHAVIVDAADTASSRSWSRIGVMAPQLRENADPALARASQDINEQAAKLIREWQSGILERIQNTAGEKRQRARVMSLGLNMLTVALMLVVFSTTAGLTGAEIGIAGGSAVVGQKLLETIFGEDTVRRMAADARRDLDQRLDHLLRAERERYHVLTDPLFEGASAESIRNAAAEARTAIDQRFPGTLAPAPTQANTPALPATTEDVNESFQAGTLRGLFDQLRGTFSPQSRNDGSAE
ncbi:GTPase [Corynebacterium riegelii]